MNTSRTNGAERVGDRFNANFRCLYIVLQVIMCYKPLKQRNTEVQAQQVVGLPTVLFSLQETATPITSGKWEVIYISKVTKDSMCV